MEEDQSLAIKEIDNIKDLSEEVLKLQQLEKNIKAKELLKLNVKVNKKFGPKQRGKVGIF